jgi:N utilization substance protein A
LSRTHPAFLINLFKTEVPEISEGLVEVKGAAREPGVRAKFAVASNDPDIDPVGACVGMKGSRVQNVVQELKGEKIDIIPWHADPAKYVCNALAPAEISRVIIDEENRSMEVIVPDEYLSIAIGKRGQNVRLASRLTGWHLDVQSETLYSQAMQVGYDSLLALPGLSISLADALYEKGFYSADEIARCEVEDLLTVRGLDEETALQLIGAARDAVLAAQEAEEATGEEDDATAAGPPDAAERSPDNDPGQQEDPFPEGQSSLEDGQEDVAGASEQDGSEIT